MTTVTAPSPYRVTPRRVLRSEWHKLRSLRSTWVTLLSTAAPVLGVGLIMGATYTSGGGDTDIDIVVLVLHDVQLGQLCLAVLGILVRNERREGPAPRAPEHRHRAPDPVHPGPPATAPGLRPPPPSRPSSSRTTPGS